MSGPGWQGIFRDLPREHGFEPLRVEGALPPDLRGALYRNGPALFHDPGGAPYAHWFDGDGAIMAVRLEEGRAEGAVRVAQTRWLDVERKARGQRYRSYAQLGRGWRRWMTLPKNPANIAVMPWNGQLLALWEAGLPHATDLETLETLGETSLGGTIGPTFAAHPHAVGDTVYSFGVAYGARFSLKLWALKGGQNGVEVIQIGSVALPRPTIIHDFIATSQHLIFFCPPIRLKLAHLLAGIESFDANLAWEPEHGTEVIVVPLADPTRPVRFTVPPFFQWHFVNAWEAQDGTLVVDYLPYDDFGTDAWFGRLPYDPPRPPPPSRYARARIDLKQKTMETEILWEGYCEFPGIRAEEAGVPHRDAWMLSFDSGVAGPPGLCCFEPGSRRVRRVPLGAGCFPSEAVFAAGGTDGWVLSQVYDGEKDASYVAVIDAGKPEAGPVARVWFDHGIPLTFHGCWVARER